MTILRLAAPLAVAALLNAGTPAMAEVPADLSAEHDMALGQRELDSAFRAYAIARGMAEQVMAAHPEQSRLFYDLERALEYGDYLTVAEHDPSRMRDMARALYGVITHIVNVTHLADGQT